MKAIGVDGCRGGWVAMVWDEGAASIRPEIHPTLAHLLPAHADAGAIAVDIPIGLSPTGTRRCDLEARKLLGVSRGSSVFPPPIPEVLDARTHEAAVLMSKSLIGKGVSRQSFAIFDKIKEANDTITPDMQNRVFEMHPEVSFHILAGRPLVHRKVTSEGYEERRALLELAMGIQLPDRNEAFKWARPAKPDDLLDATVAAWTAKAVIDGKEGRLPATPEYAESGLRMEMVFGPKATTEDSRVDESPDRSSLWSIIAPQRVGGGAGASNDVDGSVMTMLTGTCLCDCGGSTLSRFCPGHDRRVYSWLEKADRNGDQSAADLLRYLMGNHDRSTFEEQRLRIRHWCKHRG